MTERVRALYMKMVEFDRGQPALIQHFTKVYTYAVLIAEQESLGAQEREVLEAAALVHDIAIPLCIQKYGSDAGPYQEQEGPALVQKMLGSMEFDPAFVQRVCWLVAHHHTLTGIESPDHQILVEADFLVNAFEGGHTEESMHRMLDNVFKTTAGRTLLQTMFAL